MLLANIDQVPSLVELCRKSKNNLLIVGDPGVGKSQTILGMNSDHCKVTMLTGSSTYEETANGIPRDNKELGKQDYTRPAWFVDMLEWSEKHTDENDYQILFIDEFNTADPQVLKTFLTILSDRKIPTQPEPLPDNVVLVAAMNPCDQNEGEELIRPMASRFMVVQVKATIDSYSEYMTGEPVFGDPTKSETIELLDEPKELTASRIRGYLTQIVGEDWQSFEPGNYHEICPRSMSNFFRAMSWVKNPKADSAKLSMMFFGRKYRFPDDVLDKKRKEEERAEKVKNGSVVPTLAELEKMDTETLKALQPIMVQKGGAGVQCVAHILTILHKRGEN